jgi:uncharacterized protein
MTSLWNIATLVACVAVICGAAVLWWVYKGKAIERKKLVEAVCAYHARAEKRDAEPQYGLAYMYHQGKGVAQDYSEAVRWARMARNRILRRRGSAAGLCRGCSLVPQSIRPGFAKAQFALASMYYDGKGVPQDYAEAARWYRKAAEQGDALAQSMI